MLFPLAYNWNADIVPSENEEGTLQCWSHLHTRSTHMLDSRPGQKFKGFRVT